MSQITVTLPDGSSRSVPAGTSGPRRGGRDLSAARAGRARRRRRRQAGRPVVSRSSATPSVRIVTDKSPEALALVRHSTAHLLAAAVTNLFPGTQCGIGPGHRRRLLLRLRRRAPVRARGPRGDRAEDEGARLAGSRLRAADVAARGGEGVLRAARRAAEGAADRREDRRPVGSLLLHHQGQGHLRRLLRRPARADHRQAEGVQAAHQLERVLEGRRAQPADAARLRHRVPVREGPEGAPHADRGSEEARPPQARSRARAVHVPSVGAGRGVLARQGHDALQHARELHARRAVPGRLRRGEDAARLQQGAVGDARATGRTIARTCSSSSRKARR